MRAVALALYLAGAEALTPPCEDDSSWILDTEKGEEGELSCSWVKENPNTRCERKGTNGKLASESCRDTCGTCCVDDAGWILGTSTGQANGLSCSWVAGNTIQRCKRTGEDGTLASQSCCGTCCEDDPDWTLVTNNGKTVDCDWVATKNTDTRCQRPGASSACKYTCGTCGLPGDPTMSPTTSPTKMPTPDEGDANVPTASPTSSPTSTPTPLRWQEAVKLTAPDAEASDRFGSSVAVSGKLVVVGAFGNDCDPSGSDCGAAYVYRVLDDATSPLLVANLTAPDAAAFDAFGNSVAVSGELVVVGANGNDCDPSGSDCGAAYVFAPGFEDRAQS